MVKRVCIILGISLLIFGGAFPVLAQEADPAIRAAPFDLLPALLLFLPLGLILLISSALPEDQAPAAAVALLLSWGLAGLAYFLVGFAFQFGGIAQVSPNPDFGGLYWEWYPLDQSVDVAVARLWGVIAFQGWALAGEAATPSVFRLFAAHVALVGVATLIPAGVLLQRARPASAILTGLLMGTIVYPLSGNWLWGGGWLANLGANLGLGHGFVDFGGASVVFFAGSVVALMAMHLFEPTVDKTPPPPAEVVIPLDGGSPLTVYADQTEPEPAAMGLPTTPMPSAYLPILGLLGAGMSLIGWFGLTSGVHLPTAINYIPAQAGVGGLLAALSGALAAAGYSWFTTRSLDPLMIGRGLLAGLVVASAGAPFVPPGLLVLAGLLIGLALPPLIYLFTHRFELADELGVLATYGVSAGVGLLWVGLFADGRRGQGWNSLADASIPTGSGVSGWWVKAGLVADWPGQFQAQLIGLGAVVFLAVAGSLLLFQTIKAVARSWADTGLEWADPGQARPPRTARSTEPDSAIREEEVEVSESAD